MSLTRGFRLGIYEVLEPLGAGGMGEVYLARDTRLRRAVAVKVLPAALAADRDWRTRFIREAQVLASLNHPSIATIHGLEESPDGTHFLILERVEGDTLAAKLRQGAMAVPEALDLCGQIAGALEAAHAKGVVHRDLKPGNVMITPSGSIKLLDFGIASSAGAGVGAEGTSRATPVEITQSKHPDASTMMGTPGYMSPEQVRGEEQDRRTDIFSFGCVLFECLSGRRAFSGKTAAEAMGAVLYATPDLGALPGGVPSGVRTLLERCLEKDPAGRLRDIGDARMEIEAAKGTHGTRAVPVIAAPPHNLPKPRTSFVGREKELAECARLLEENRVLTLTGVGGSGKTRLALRIAEGRLRAHRDGAWFVDLAPIQDEERVPVAVATALGVKEEPGGTLLESLSVHLTEKDVLLVLDNCEHLLGACTELAETLLEASPGLKLLATSREGLGLEGERLFAVRSLGVPRREAWHDAHAVEASDSVHLFVDRARAVEGRFALTAANAPIIAEICRRLDGIPLAIELAAGRVKVLSVEQIRSKLDDRFRLLTGGSKTALPRHQTLRATVQWSYDQLEEAERDLLQTLSVFAGGWTLEGATAVAGEGADEFEVLDHLTRLVDKSLVVVEREEGGEPRYRMLETVRQYAEERLSESGHGAAARSRHLDFYVTWAEAIDSRLIGPEQGECLAKLDIELENVLSAISWCGQAEGGAAKGLRLVSAVRNYWDSRGLNELGARVSRDALARDTGGELVMERLKLRGALTSMLQRRGLVTESIEVAEGTMALAKEMGDPVRIAMAHRALGVGLSLLGRIAEARREIEESVRLMRGQDDKARLAGSLGALGEIDRLEGRNAEALASYEESLALLREAGDLDSVTVQLVNLAMVAIDAGDAVRARAHLREGTQIAEKIAGKYIGTAAVMVIGALAGVDGDPARAARLWGAAAGARERMGVVLDPPDVKFLEPHVARVRSEMGTEAFSAAERQGRAVPYESALGEARAWLEGK
jgi:predicted ATPase